jgi:transcriptional regulator with XRE-family HTH domain
VTTLESAGTGSTGTGSTGTESSGSTTRRRRVELAEFLKARRARLTPNDVGLPPGTRRRTAGLRREEVALLAGVGITWYTWLEQGRPINVSIQVLDAVARTLRLDRAERTHMYELAAATPTRWSATTQDVPDAMLDVVRSLDPLPTVLINARFDVIASNEAYEELFWYWHSRPCDERNQLMCCLTEPRAREQYLNYDEEVPHLVARLRTEYARNIGNPEWEDNIAQLSAISPEFTELWARHEVAEPEPRTRRFAHPHAGILNFVSNELVVSATPGTRMQVYTPLDDETWERLPRTRHT